MGALISLVYGTAVYVFFLCTFVYAIGFVGGVFVPKTVDSGTPAPLIEALAVNFLVLGIFAFQHSLMARRSFKRWWTQIVPPAVERSTYVLAATLALALLLWQWRPIPQPIVWSVESVSGTWLVWAMFWLGWAVLLASTFLINHFELFGLHQVANNLAGRPMAAVRFKTPVLYKLVRHPIYLGFIVAFWATPVMTVGHLLFAAVTTAYIFVGIFLEERDLVAQFGEQYTRYRAQVGMLIPFRRKAS